MTEPITITHATSADRAELERLAGLDSGHVPAAPALLARVDGELRAAIGVNGETVADPFHPTAEIVTLLRLAAEQEGEVNRAA
ncbi:MAG TPA: hypothetical protein VFB44_02105 [Thermoleophilaceae bacterium]|nr:hypothetical protein [Thermoleophilaceae bacterium]